MQSVIQSLKKCMELYKDLKQNCTQKCYVDTPIDVQILFNDNINEYFGQVLASKIKLIVRGIILHIHEGLISDEDSKTNLLKNGYYLWLLYTMENKLYVDYMYDINKIEN